MIICLRERKIERVIDSGGRSLRLYSEVPLILKRLEAKRFPMGLASRSSQPLSARDLLKLFGISGSFAYQEVFPGSKLAQFENFAAASGSQYSEMLFLDDELRNVHEVGGMRVHCVEVKTGINLNVFESGLDLFLSGNIFLMLSRLLPRLCASSSLSKLPGSPLSCSSRAS